MSKLSVVLSSETTNLKSTCDEYLANTVVSRLRTLVKGR